MLEMHFFVTSSLKHSCRAQQQVQNYRKCLKKQFFGESKLSFFCVESNSMNVKLYWHAAVTCIRKGLRRKHVLCDGDGNRPTARANKEKASGPDWLARLRYGRDSNPRPPAWQAGILTSWTTTPFVIVALCDFSHLRCKITTHFPYLQYPSQKIDKKISFSALKIIFCATFTPLSLKY